MTLGRLTFSIDGDRSLLDRTISQVRTDAGKLPIKLALGVDNTALKTSLQQAVTQIQKQDIKLKLKLDTSTALADLRSLRITAITVDLKVRGLATAQNDFNTLRGLLAGLGANMTYRVVVQTTALQAVYTQINTQITALQSLISQLRALGAGGGGGGGGGAGRGGISAANRTLLAELEALNNSWKRGDIGAAAFGAQLTALQGRLRTASAGATAGTADFRALDAGLTRLTGSLRSINTDAFQKLRTDAGAMRAAFDAATAGFRRNSTEFRAASAVYATEGARITAQLQNMARAGNLTTTQLGQVNREIQRLAREQNTIRGGINAGGLSGNIVNSFGMLPGQLGMMASQGGAAINAFAGIAAAAGPAGLAVAGLGAATLGAAFAAGKAVNEYAKFEAGLAQVATLTDKTTAQLGETGRQILKISGEVGATYTDLNAGLYDVLGAGVKGTESMTASLQLLRQAAMLGKAGATDTKTATDVLTSVMNAYQLSATDATMVSDKLFKAVDDGKMSFAQLAQSLGMVLPTAKMAGLSLDEVLGSVAALTAQGVKPSSAIEYLRSALTNIVKPSMQAKETAADLGIQFDAQGLKAKGLTGFLRDVIVKTDGNSEAMARLFGDIGALTAVTGLANGDFQRLTKTLEGQAAAAGKTAEAYTKVAATIESKSDSVAAKWKSLWIGVGEAFAPMKLSILTGIDEMLTKLNSAAELTQRLRNANGTQNRLAETERGIAANESAAARARSILADPNAGAFAKNQATNNLPKYEATLNQLRADLVTLRADVAQQQADFLQTSTTALPKGVQGPNFGGVGEAYATEVIGKTLISLLGMGGRTVLNEFGVSGKDYKHDGAVRADAVHNGVDYAAPRGTPILAPFSGTLSVREDKTNGKVFELVDEMGNKLVGIHLDSFDKGVQEALAAGGGKALIGQGTKIGGVGRSGTTAGSASHLHLMGYAAGSKTATSPLDIAFRGGAGGAGDDAYAVAPSDASNTNKEKDIALTGVQIVQAQKLVAALEKATKLKAANPTDIALTKSLASATVNLEKFSKASDGNAAAVKAVQSGWEGSKKAANDYIATQADLNKYGKEALELIKRQGQAAKSGNAEQIRAADEAMKLWQGESKARIAVTQVENAAYQSRKAAANEAEQDAKAQEAREKAARALSASVAEAARQGDVTLAKQREATLAQMRENDLRGTEDSAAAKLAVEQRYAGKQEQAAKAVADLEYRNAMRAAVQGKAQNREQAEKIALGEKNAAYLKAEADARDRVSAAQKGMTEQSKKSVEESAALTGRLAEETAKRAQEIQAQAARVNEALRQNNIAAAGEEVTRLEAMRQKDLDGVKDSAQGRYRVEKQYADQIYNAKKAVLDKEKKDRDADIKNGDLPAKVKAGQLKTSDATYTNALNAAKATRDGLLSESEKGITDLGVKLASTLALSVGEGLEAGIKSKRAGEALDGQLAAWGVKLSQSLFDNAIASIKQLRADTDASLREFGGVTTDMTTGEDVYQTEEEIRRLGLTTEGTTGEFFNLADAIENAGSLGRDELQELIRVSKLGTDAALELWAAWNKENPVDLGKQLDGIMQAQALMDQLEGAVDPIQIQSITGEIADFLASDVGKLLPDGVRQGLTDGVEGAGQYKALLTDLTADAITDGWERAGKVTAGPENMFQDFAAQIMGGDFDLSNPGTLRGLNEGLDEAFKKGQLTAGQLDTLRVIIDSINNAPLLITGKDSDTAVLESTIGAITSRIDEAQASYESGASGADEYNAALIEQEAALLKLLVNLDKLGPVGAGAAASVRLLLDATTASIDPTARLADEVGALGQEKAAELAQQAIKLSQGLQAGTITQKEFNSSAVDMLPTLDLLARSLGDGSEEGEKAAATVRAIAQDLRDMGAATSEAHSKLEKLGDGFQKLSTGLSSVFKGFGATGMGQIADGLGGIVSAASKAPGALADVRTSWAAFKTAPDGGALGGLLGSLGGVAGIAGSVISAVGAIGDAVMNMSPAFQAWKKGLLDVAEAEKAAMGQRKVGGNNGFLNPYYDSLKADAEALTTKANGGFWQQIAWQIFGGAPETMDKAASEVLQQSSIMFNEFGSSLYGTLESSLMNAFESGDWSGTEAAFEKSLNGLMARMALQAIIATSDLGDRIQGLVDARVSAMADGVISADEQAGLDNLAGGIRSSAQGIRSSFQAIAPSLPGYGAGGADGASGGPGGSLFGAGAGAQLGIPRIEANLLVPDILVRSFDSFAATTPIYNEASIRMLQAADLIFAAHSGLQRPTGLGSL